MSLYYRITIVLILGSITTLNAATVEIIESSPKTEDGQTPFWCEETRSLYYCDPLDPNNSTILRYCPADRRVYRATVDGYPYIGFIRPVEGAPDRFVIGCTKTVEEIRWDGKASKAKWVRTVFVTENCTEFETNVFQDGKADLRGRLFCGTRRSEFCINLANPTYANLFRVSADEPPATLSKPMTVRTSNGMAWDENINKYYSIDSCDWDIKSYDYCPYTGDIWNEQIVYNYTEGGQRADRILKGLVCDKKGFLWVGLFGGGEVRQIDPRNGTVIQTITLPCNQISGVCFGEENWDIIYVTTAAITTFGPQSNEAGKVFRLSDLGACDSPTRKVFLP